MVDHSLTLTYKIIVKRLQLGIRRGRPACRFGNRRQIGGQRLTRLVELSGRTNLSRFKVNVFWRQT